MAAASQAALPVTTCPAARRDLKRNRTLRGCAGGGTGQDGCPHGHTDPSFPAQDPKNQLRCCGHRHRARKDITQPLANSWRRSRLPQALPSAHWVCTTTSASTSSRSPPGRRCPGTALIWHGWAMGEDLVGRRVNVARPRVFPARPSPPRSSTRQASRYIHILF